jgi:hypothetical protein
MAPDLLFSTDESSVPVDGAAHPYQRETDGR